MPNPWPTTASAGLGRVAYGRREVLQGRVPMAMARHVTLAVGPAGASSSWEGFVRTKAWGCEAGGRVHGGRLCPAFTIRGHDTPRWSALRQRRSGSGRRGECPDGGGWWIWGAARGWGCTWEGRICSAATIQGRHGFAGLLSDGGAVVADRGGGSLRWRVCLPPCRQRRAAHGLSLT